MTNLRGKTILITGGTGSFGNELLRSILSQDFKEVRVFSRDELKQEMMRNELKNPKIKFHIGDVRDIDSVHRVMKGVDLVFHAAALKQVPSCEFFPMQAVLTNIVGSHNVIDSAVKHGVERMICLSTDKAVYPVNTMGTTKSLMEKVALATARALSKRDTVISCVRYGNVLYSRGSVIPLFVRQVKEKKPITITDPHMTRFLLPLKNAIDLVLFAFVHAEQGDTFIRKAPVATIEDLAKAVKTIFRSSVPIKVIGIRHGEKKHETLATIEELRRAEDMGEYLRIAMDDRDLNYDKYFIQGDIKESSLDDYTSDRVQKLTVREVEKLLLALPEVKAELK